MVDFVETFLYYFGMPGAQEDLDEVFGSTVDADELLLAPESCDMEIELEELFPDVSDLLIAVDNMDIFAVHNEKEFEAFRTKENSDDTSDLEDYSDDSDFIPTEKKFIDLESDSDLEDYSDDYDFIPTKKKFIDLVSDSDSVDSKSDSDSDFASKKKTEKKLCSDCNIFKGLTEFSDYYAAVGNEKRKYKRSACKKCCAKRTRKYYKRNAKERRRYRRKYYQKNKETILWKKREKERKQRSGLK